MYSVMFELEEVNRSYIIKLTVISGLVSKVMF